MPENMLFRFLAVFYSIFTANILTTADKHDIYAFKNWIEKAPDFLSATH
jgi:hypothetical protein